MPRRNQNGKTHVSEPPPPASAPHPAVAPALSPTMVRPYPGDTKVREPVSVAAEYARRAGAALIERPRVFARCAGVAESPTGMNIEAETGTH